MAASIPNCLPGEEANMLASGAESDNDPWIGRGPIVKREPALKLQSPVSGIEPLAWSEDHRLAASSTGSVSIMELVCDVNSNNPDLVLHRTSIPVPESVCKLKVGPEEEVQKARDKFSSHKDPAVNQPFMMDRVINPHAGHLRGVKYTSWSFMGCDGRGRCLLACLTLDNRLVIYNSHKRLQWTPLMDLTEMYGEMLESREYSAAPGETPLGSLDDLSELQRRYEMQTPVRMEWSSMCNTQQMQTDNVCKDVGTVLLAVLMENGDLVVWQFSLPVQGKDSVVSCSTIKSGVSSPSVLAWWEYEHGGRKMSGLIVGSTAGPVKILPVNLKAVKGYFTLRKPVVLWKESDQIPVHNIKCVSLYHPHQKCNCSLVVAARGSYLFWCLLLITKAGLNVHNSHVTGLHSTPIASVTTRRQGGSIYTCSLDGKVKKLTPVFTDVAVMFKQEEVALPEGVAGRRIHGIAVSPNGAYMALLSAEGMSNGLHPVRRTYQVQFVTLKTPDEAAAELLESSVQNLFRQADLLDLVRWRVLADKCIPPLLQEELDEKVQTTGCSYLWRFKLFLLRFFYQSLQVTPTGNRYKPTFEESKVFVGDEEAEGERQEAGAETSRVGEGSRLQATERKAKDEQMSVIEAWIKEVESHLTREHMKKVLGDVYLHTIITENTSIPTRGLCDFLSNDTTCEDRAAKVLIGHIFKKIHKQTFPEYCRLCNEVLPFTDCKQAKCSNGHMWLRCVLSYHACQSLTYRRCLLQDSIARLPVPEDPDWIRRILQNPCTFCDSPLI